MKNFYIFLDIDGVMYDWDYIISEINAGKIRKGAILNKFKPESIDALNLLIEALSNEFHVGLVISSTWRSDMELTIKTLRDNGLLFDNKIESTPLSYDPSNRGEEILKFLEHKQNYNFVIIDDEMFDYKKHFKKEQIIKCDMFKQALSLDMVQEFLKVNNINIESDFVMEE